MPPVARFIMGAVALVALLGGLLFGLLLVPVPFVEPPWREERDASAYLALAVYDGRPTLGDVEAARAIVDPLNQLSSFVRIEDEQLTIYLDDARRDAAVRMRLRTEETTIAPRLLRRRSRPVRSLVGRRVLLDPGHHGGAWSEAESRHFELPSGIVREGDLTYATARLLQDMLIATGADVRLTRGPPPTTPFAATTIPIYDAEHEAALVLGEHVRRGAHAPWVARFPSLVAYAMLRRERQRLLREQPFELYNHFDLRQRAELAAAWRPDVTLSLHFNLAQRPEVNGVIVFVPGNFLAGELDSRTERLWAVRHLVDGSLPMSIALGRSLGWAMQRRFGLGAMPYDEAAAETAPQNKRPIDVAAGLYARNLAILKRTPGPVLLLEGPCMNNPKESMRLADRSLVVDGAAMPARLREYATAVVEALLDQAPAQVSTGAAITLDARDARE